MCCRSSMVSVVTVAALLGLSFDAVFADPCGMVPPIYEGVGAPITRVGEQQTYVFFKDGVESFVIHPGFSGKVDEFGMLIPFPTPPELRKMPDHIFPHLAAAVDPPEVVIDLTPRPFEDAANAGAAPGASVRQFSLGRRGSVRVLREEAAGMYEVAVLEAGSAKALKRWMDDHGFRYPDGMEDVTEEYVELGWCFVAVKSKVGQKKGVDPKPGQRQVDSRLPAGSTFDGRVQAMGFRFTSKELVVPMRLSAFNDGKLRNIVYLLTDGPRKIRSIPEEYVVRQIQGPEIFKNLTGPLPLRIIGGVQTDLQKHHLQGLSQRRKPHAKNGAAKELFASDLLAIASGRLSLPHEEQEKELLRIGEHFGLRGTEVDGLNAQALQSENDQIAKSALKSISTMTLTVVDGDFPRDVLAKNNLTFGSYKMPSRRNRSSSYDANLKGPAPKKRGILVLGAFKPNIKNSISISAQADFTSPKVVGFGVSIGLALIGVCLLVVQRRRSN